MSSKPCCTATCSGVLPRALPRFTTTEGSPRIRSTMGVSPCAAARCSGVRPRSSVWLMSTPKRFRRDDTIATSTSSWSSASMSARLGSIVLRDQLASCRTQHYLLFTPRRPSAVGGITLDLLFSDLFLWQQYTTSTCADDTHAR
eukprot:4074003-Prymnesium_polylepis.2